MQQVSTPTYTLLTFHLFPMTSESPTSETYLIAKYDAVLSVEWFEHDLYHGYNILTNQTAP